MIFEGRCHLPNPSQPEKPEMQPSIRSFLRGLAKEAEQPAIEARDNEQQSRYRFRRVTRPLAIRQSDYRRRQTNHGSREEALRAGVS